MNEYEKKFVFVFADILVVVNELPNVCVVKPKWLTAFGGYVVELVVWICLANTIGGLTFNKPVVQPVEPRIIDPVVWFWFIIPTEPVDIWLHKRPAELEAGAIILAVLMPVNVNLPLYGSYVNGPVTLSINRVSLVVAVLLNGMK